MKKGNKYNPTVPSTVKKTIPADEYRPLPKSESRRKRIRRVGGKARL